MICLDASIVGVLISPDEQSENALEHYEKNRLHGEVFIAPTLLTFEIASILRKKELRKLLSRAEIVGALHYFKGLEIQLRDFDELIERALALSQSFGPSLTVYDASYLAVAEHYHASLWTADKALHHLVSIAFGHVKLIAAH